VETADNDVWLSHSRGAAGLVFRVATTLVGNFSQVIPQQGGKPDGFRRRCACGADRSSPLLNALYLINQHASDKDFTDVVALIEHAKALLPPTPTSLTGRSSHLLGLVALFRNRPVHAASVRRGDDG